MVVKAKTPESHDGLNESRSERGLPRRAGRASIAERQENRDIPVVACMGNAKDCLNIQMWDLPRAVRRGRGSGSVLHHWCADYGTNQRCPRARRPRAGHSIRRYGRISDPRHTHGRSTRQRMATRLAARPAGHTPRSRREVSLDRFTAASTDTTKTANQNRANSEPEPTNCRAAKRAVLYVREAWQPTARTSSNGHTAFDFFGTSCGAVDLAAPTAQPAAS